MISSGILITFEGIEGSGKTSQMDLAEAELKRAGHQVFRTREPGGTPIGEKIRSVFLSAENNNMDPVAELFLIEACRAQLVRERILPELEMGRVVLCDRFTDATMAYQGFGRPLDRGFIEQLNRFAAEGIEPDLTVLLDCPVNEGLQRVRERYRAVRTQEGTEGMDRLEGETVQFHERVRQGYRELAEKQESRIRVVDATEDMGVVHGRIMRLIFKVLGEREKECRSKKS